eukprot:TRINITY_DN16442_c0_g1_i3.p1 TRINITY_DN16442_c0_g1~~TRINITY_DN16442_c0_g1_i3.p1  ORF type:complete len:359 (-),score=6.11 TRINITY_DN16442_c0_g1_i3:88-1164(-)
MKWCPYPACEYSIRVRDEERTKAVTCKCGFSFCYSCCDYLIGAHNPATCDDVARWLQRANAESENIKWLMANTKKCTKCNKNIEKNGGCMHMTCRREAGGCGHEFCWLCRQDWHAHNPAECNRRQQSGEEKLRTEEIGRVKSELDHYMFYYHRYQAHHSARLIAENQLRDVEKRNGDISTLHDTSELLPLKAAAEVLVKGRLTLEYSYVFGFWFSLYKPTPAETEEHNRNKNLFEFLQEDVEKYTNLLSEHYEKELPALKDFTAFTKWRGDLVNTTQLTNKFLDKFVEAFQTGKIGAVDSEPAVKPRKGSKSKPSHDDPVKKMEFPNLVPTTGEPSTPSVIGEPPRIEESKSKKCFIM